MEHPTTPKSTGKLGRRWRSRSHQSPQDGLAVVESSVSRNSPSKVRSGWLRRVPKTAEKGDRYTPVQKKQQREGPTEDRKPEGQEQVSEMREPESPSPPAESSWGNADWLPGKTQLKLVYHQFGTNACDVLELEQEDGVPQPETVDHVVVRVEASSVTLNDSVYRRGFCFDVVDPLCLPLTPGHDFVGQISCCGSHVKEFKEGDRVAALVRTGGNARYISVHKDTLVKVPKLLDAAQAAAMVTIYTTAYQSLKLISNQETTFSMEGKKVFIIGGWDGVSHALAQMCLKAHAEVFVTSPTNQRKHTRSVMKSVPLPENAKDWLPIVRGQMDYVFDGVCEDGLKHSLQALKSGGELVSFGYHAMLNEGGIGIFGAPLSAHVSRLYTQTLKQAKTIDIWESYEKNPAIFKKNLKSLFQLLKWGKVKPPVAKRVALADVAMAQLELESGTLRGPVICLPWKKSES